MKLKSFNQPGSKRTKLAVPPMALALVTAASMLLPEQSVYAQGAVLEEIIVTARKREESLQEIPVVVNVLTAENVANARIEGVADLGDMIPGLVTSESSASTQGVVFLRGVGTGSLSPLLDQAVALNVDGISVSSASLLNAGMFDLDRIEVLRGPQALFFGKNSPGGVMAIHTTDPSDGVEVVLSAQYETEGEEPILRAVVSGPLSDDLGGRLSLGYSDADSLLNVNNSDVFVNGPTGDPVQVAFATDTPRTEKVYALGTLRWEPTDELTATLKLAHLEDNLDGASTHNFERTQCPNGPLTVLQVPGIDNCTLDGTVIGPGLNPVFTAVDPNFPGVEGDGFYNNTENFASLQVNYALSDSLDLTSVSGYYGSDLERIAESSIQLVPGLLSSVKGGIDQVSQEFRLNSDFDGAVNFAIGVFYEDREIRQNQAVTVGSTFAGLPAELFGVFPAAVLGQDLVVQNGETLSAFAQVDWEITDKLALTVGARYSDEQKKLDLSVNNVSFVPGVFPETGGGEAIPIAIADDTLDFDNFSPEATLSYRYSDDVMLFASYKEGFKSGGFDAGFTGAARLLATTAPDLSFQEEVVDGIDFGMKSTLLDGSLRLNATFYHYNYDGLQLTRLVNNPDGSVGTSVENAASATVQGVELETLWATSIDGLTLTANIAYNDAQYEDYIASCYQGQTVALGCNLNPVDGVFTASDLSGESLANASDISATFGIDYLVSVSSNWDLGFNASAAFKEGYNPTTVGVPESYYQDDYWLTNASLSLNSADDKWQFFVRGINLGDEYYSATGSFFGGNDALSGTNDPSGIGDFFQYVNGGRQFLLGFNYRL